jgi:cyclopropane-fatty-acyl-phospholipid synthase
MNQPLSSQADSQHQPTVKCPPEQPTVPPPADTNSRSTSEVTGFDRWLLRTLLKRIGDPPIDVRLWDDKPLADRGDSGEAELSIRDRATLWKLVVSPEFHFGEAYTHGQITVRGELIDLCERIYRSLPAIGRWGRVRRRFHHAGAHSVSASRHNVHRHYDLGNDFYRLWLDEQLVYTCAYFPHPETTLEAAQVEKMDYVCRKLRLQPGQHVVEAGCGWGALALHMAREYRVRVRAYNLSHEQVVFARQRAMQEGLSDRVEFIEDDWRNISGSYDAVVSVGMLEHVGIENYPLLGEVIHRSLKNPGIGLIHTIGKNIAEPLNSWIEKRIFPGAAPPSLAQMMKVFERGRFSVLDVENLRLHYARTLKHWLQRFEEHVETVRDMYDEEFVRTWRLYLSGSVAAFMTGDLQLFQVVFTQADNNQIPWTRSALYQRKDHSFESASCTRHQATQT